MQQGGRTISNTQRSQKMQYSHNYLRIETNCCYVVKSHPRTHKRKLTRTQIYIHAPIYASHIYTHTPMFVFLLISDIGYLDLLDFIKAKLCPTSIFVKNNSLLAICKNNRTYLIKANKRHTDHVTTTGQPEGRLLVYVSSTVVRPLVVTTALLCGYLSIKFYTQLKARGQRLHA